jgi:hypothetical protein
MTKKRPRPRNVMILRRRRAQVILQLVARKYMVSLEDLMSDDRSSGLVAARREFFERAKAEGIGSTTIAKTIRRNHSTVLYHLKPDMQAARRERYIAKTTRSKSYEPDTHTGRRSGAGIEPATARAEQLPPHGDAVRGGEARIG